MLLSMCHASKGHCRNIHLSLCVIFIDVSVLVCHASKDYGRNFHLKLIVRVNSIGLYLWRCVMFQKDMVVIFILLCVSVCHFHWCVRVAVCLALKCYGIIIHISLCVRVSFSLVCPCGGVSCFKML